jgi:hypothetical protein
MSKARKSEGETKIRASWGGKLGKWRDPPPPPRSSGRQTSRPPLDSAAVAPDAQFAGTEQALGDAISTIHRLKAELLVARRDAEGLRLALAQIRVPVNRDRSTP